MITFILLGAFFMIAVLFAAVAYSANQRKHAGQSGVAASTATHHKQGRATPVNH